MLQCVIHKRYIYLWLAVALHFALNFSALAVSRFGILWSELVATAFAAALVLYVRRVRPVRTL